MKIFKSASIILFSLFLSHLVQAADSKLPDIMLQPAKPGPGDIVIVTVKGGTGRPEGTFNGRKIYFNPSKDSFKAVLGVDLNTEPGTYKLDISEDGTVTSRTVTVVKKIYPLDKLTLHDKDKVELSPENEARADREQQKLSMIWPIETDRVWDGDFVNPREGKISTAFGLRRLINGLPRSPHTGVDVAAEAGEEVHAPNNGVVVLVGDLFFSGNSVFLDHGQGIYSMFFHLSKVLVKQGQHVKKGEAIGLVGSTGRSTGAHLHWGVRIQGARVDPLELIKLNLE